MITTPYEILGVKEDATPSEIKSAYKALVKIYHPDINPTPNAATFFRLVQSAYETLTNGDINSKEHANCEQGYQHSDPDIPQYTKEEFDEVIKNVHIIKNKPLRIFFKVPVYVIAFVLNFITFALVFIAGFSRLAGGLLGGLAALCFIVMLFTEWDTSVAIGVVLLFGISGILCFAVDVVIGMLQTIKHFLQEIVR